MSTELSDDESSPEATQVSHAARFQAEITRVSGRRAGGQRGLPALETFALRTPDGTMLEFGPPGRGAQGSLHHLVTIAPAEFEKNGIPICPICIDGRATDREHVPQRNLGGRVMTKTCKACNNGLGTKVEADLQLWFDNAHKGVRFSHNGSVPGRRHVPDIYRLEADDGTFVMFIDGDVTSEVQQIMESGEFTASIREPNLRRCGVALLKHAYLAACLALRSVPDTSSARSIRADLLAARNATSDADLPDSDAVKRLRVYRSHAGRQGPPLALVADFARAQDGSPPELLISLAGVLFVTWPFPDALAGSFVRGSDVQ